MAGGDINDDEYVANLLKQDAQKTAKQYKLVGLDAFSTRSRTEAPKPNTRFLRHIIRETDSHNSALLAKEAEESRARLRRLTDSQKKTDGRLTSEDDSRRREDGRLTPPDISEDRDRHAKRRKRSHREEEPEPRHSRRREERDHRTTKESRSRRDDGKRDRARRERDAEKESPKHRSRHSNRRGESPEQKPRERTSRRSDDSRRNHRSSSPSSTKHHKSSRHRHRSSSRHRSRSRDRSREHRRRSPVHPKQKSPTYDSDSDPLEAIVGPMPPAPAPSIRARGRGAHKINASTMDSRFSSAYDPTADVHLASDIEDEWGDALEAHRDRQKWKQAGAERLKAAGFSEEQVRKWEKGDEKTEEDVKWALKGEGREWDRGKVVGDDGDVRVKAEWGRLT